MELMGILLLLSIGTLALARGGGPRERLAACSILLVAGAVGWARLSSPPAAGGPDDPATRARPAETRFDGYVSSDACQSCHPREWSTWNESYHRTMTQIVTPETMLADWDGTRLEHRGNEYVFETVGDRYWVDMVDAEFDPERRYGGRPVAKTGASDRVRRRVVQSTGSHHQQIYWYSSGRGRELYLLPFTWLVPEAKWVPYESTLLWRRKPFETTEEWNTTCVPCHATAGQPRPVEFSRDFDTRTAELGIGCESCHGPGARHVERYREPLNRFLARWSGEAPGDAGASRIRNPASMSAERSSQVCGQCHSHGQPKGRQEAERAAISGSSYRPGDELSRTRELHQRPPSAKLTSPRLRYQADAISWEDGVVRTAGRDYHGVVESPCFEGEEYSCLTCHSMHSYQDRDDQLKPGMRGNAACTQCHSDLESATAVQTHSHHAADSTGSNCYSCHMPHSNYALLKTVRSHRLSSPTVKESIETGRPNACNLCHLDQTLEWTAHRLEEWYGQQVDLPPGFAWSKRAASVDWLLEGDAAQRGIIAATMARSDPRAASGSTWMAPLLAQLVDDQEYPALSLISRNALESLPGFEDVETDARDARERVIARWQELPREPGTGPHLYQTPAGELERSDIQAAYDRRDRRAVNIAE